MLYQADIHSIRAFFHLLEKVVVSIKRVILGSILTALVMISPVDASEQQYVGVRRITTLVAGVQVGVRVFYPTSAVASATRFGPWELMLAKNAKPSGTPRPLILISHGLGGNDWNHHLLARTLVQSGFLVAAVRHPDDLLRVGHPEHFSLRPLELHAALDAVLAQDEFYPLVDQDRVGAFGFSLGGYTVLAAAGGSIDLSKIDQHCATAENDPEFCQDEPLSPLLRLKRMVYSVPDIPEESGRHRIRAIVAAAPVGLPFDDLSEITQPVMLIRAGRDRTLRYPYHAEWVHRLLPEMSEYKVVEGLHHYAFLSPFPARITSEVGEPAQDPDGFDRGGFLKKMNKEISTFFQKTLL